RLVVQLLTCLCLMTRLGQLTPVNLCSGEVFVKCCFNDGDFQLKLHEMGQSPSTYAHTHIYTHTHTHTHTHTRTHTHTHTHSLSFSLSPLSLSLSLSLCLPHRLPISPWLVSK